ncbi:hypothetical protein M0M57_02870 [Flavobacterium azooxidireducens]|uniref:Uncharacterized protein n=1 Tax=Flavobacterium azooxidireducens TaxID=1871076 RepID=A0ABY4KG60_9FLAO|nr:hypothetical protein [Flavobacterium azooxidireducens]UPQ79787.1 hypothetical protein M0M57_02870 [Flavobacterium azooxidireducens]
MKKILLLFSIFLFTLCSCKKEKSQSETDLEPKPFFAPSTVLEEPKAEPTYHEDTATQYEYRVGESGDYTYNYDVVGEDSKGNKVSGNITIKDQYGNGKLTNHEGSTFTVTAEWIGYGKLLAKDEKENEYFLVAE